METLQPTVLVLWEYRFGFEFRRNMRLSVENLDYRSFPEEERAINTHLSRTWIFYLDMTKTAPEMFRQLYPFPYWKPSSDCPHREEVVVWPIKKPTVKNALLLWSDSKELFPSEFA